MLWTCGMPSYNNFVEVFFTVQALKMYHNLRQCEIIVVDNYGDDYLKEFCQEALINYERFTKITGVSAAKNRLFEVAKGKNVLCMDSHILLKQGIFDIDLPNNDLYQGPMLRVDTQQYTCDMIPEWREKMWGIWAPKVTELPEAPFEIWAMGAGFLACRREAWLGFNPEFRGFGGETGYIQEKYRKAGRKVWCHPKMIWMHLFGRKVPYPLILKDRVKNYIIGFKELGLDIRQIHDHFKRYDNLFMLSGLEID